MDSLPKVTLLGPAGNTYMIAYGAKIFEFYAGKPLRVPVPIALLARKKKDRKGGPLFSVQQMPEIVAPRPAVESKGSATVKARKGQNVTARTSQTELEI